jgi:hypothetical protein
LALVIKCSSAQPRRSGYAESAVSAVVYTLYSRTRPAVQPTYAVWAAELPVDAIEERLLELADGDAHQVDTMASRHPAVVAERRRQRHDLGELVTAEAAHELTTAVAAVRARAVVEPLTLDWPSA